MLAHLYLYSRLDSPTSSTPPTASMRSSNPTQPSTHHAHSTYEVYIIESCDYAPEPGPDSTSYTGEAVVSHPLTLVLRLPKPPIWRKVRFSSQAPRDHRTDGSISSPNPLDAAHLPYGDIGSSVCASSHVRVCRTCSWRGNKSEIGDHQLQSRDVSRAPESFTVKVGITRKGSELDGICVELWLASSLITTSEKHVRDTHAESAMSQSQSDPSVRFDLRNDDDRQRQKGPLLVRLDTREKGEGFASHPEGKDVVYTHYFERHVQLAGIVRNYFVRVVKVKQPLWRRVWERINPECAHKVAQAEDVLPIVITDDVCKEYQD